MGGQSIGLSSLRLPTRRGAESRDTTERKTAGLLWMRKEGDMPSLSEARPDSP